MQGRMVWGLLVLAALGMTGPVGCQPASEPVKIVAIDLGSAITDDKAVLSPAQTYAPNSTVYASIATEGSGPATLAARWIGTDGQVLAEQTQSISPTEPTHFEFHFAPAGGWPKGRHRAIFTLNGTGTRTREFEVR